jgi:hypothetical protein
MSLSWPATVGTAININVATLGALGTGDFTIVVLTKPAGNHGHFGAKVSTSFDIQQLNDSNIWFGGGDFSGFGTSNNTDWHVIGHSKASGTNAYRWHYWNYSAGGSKTHTPGSGTHANPGTITAIQIGNSDNRGNGLIAAVAVWKRVLSDAEFDSLCTTNLSDWMNVSGGQPDAIWALNVAAASVVDGTGHGNDASSVTGTITSGAADPPSFSYTLSGGSPVTVSDVPTLGLRLRSAAETVAVGVTAADTASLGLRARSPNAETVTIGVTAADAPGSIRMRSGAESVAFAVTVADSPNGLRAGSPNAETVTLGTAAADLAPSGLRIGSGTTESVTIAVTAPDSPGGLRLRSAVESVTSAVLAADAPGGLRIRSADGSGVTSAVAIADSPSGARLGVPTAGVTIAVVVADTPGGLRALSGATSVTVAGTSAVSIADSPSGLRLGSGLSVATVLQPILLVPILAPVHRATVVAPVGGTVIIAPVRGAHE